MCVCVCVFAFQYLRKAHNKKVSQAEEVALVFFFFART